MLGPGQDGRTIQPEGIRASALSAAQQTMLLDLVREWAGIMNDAFAEPRMAEIRANLPQTYFAWSGPTTNGSAAYFRIQGPTLVIEYAPQSSVDHIHTIYRDPTNDYGAKFTREVAVPSASLAADDGHRRRRASCRRIDATSTCRRRGSPSNRVACRSNWT